MEYELALIAVVIGGGYWGATFVRTHQLRGYGAMLLGAAALSALGLIGRHYERPELGLPGAIGAGAGGCLLVLGPMVRTFARRMAASERFGFAKRLFDLAEVLAPGSGVGDEKVLLGAMREIREGNIAPTVDALAAARERAPAEARLAIDERIAMLYLAAYRWDDAIAHAEAHLFGSPPPAEGPGPNALRRELGIAPPLWVELLAAYGYTGDLERAAQMLARLEDVCAGRDDAALWLHRGRVTFLALAGRVGAVESLVAPRRARHMKRSARSYWLGVAHERSGERGPAEAAYRRARSGSRGKPRELIDRAIARLADARPTALPPAAAELVARVEAAAPPHVVVEPARQRPWGMYALVLAICVAAMLETGFGANPDVATLVRAGALSRALVEACDQPWRLVSCLFVHVSTLHLFVNVVAITVIGRIAEQLFGAWRMLALFALTGVAGSVASVYAAPEGLAVGASAAVLGLLGASFVELALHRKRHMFFWKRGAWVFIMFACVALTAHSLDSPVIDRWAHGAGLLAGVLAGAAFSPHVRGRQVTLYVARAITLAFAALVVACGVMVARTPLAATLAAAPRTAHVIDGATVEVPADWHPYGNSVSEPDFGVMLGVRHGVSLAAATDSWRAELHDSVARIDVAPEQLLPLTGWQTTELAVTLAGPEASHEPMRSVIAVRDADGTVVVLHAPESLVRAAPGFFAGIITQIR